MRIFGIFTNDFFQMNEQFKAHIALVLAQLCFSGFHICASIVLRPENHVDPLVFAMYREILACICMYAVMRHSRNLAQQRIYPRQGDFIPLLICGLCSYCNVVGSLFALEYLRPTEFSIMQPLNPIIAAALNWRIEKFSVMRLFGVAVAVGGAILVQLQLDPGTQSAASTKNTDANSTLGFVIAFIQVASMATLITIQRHSLQEDDYHPAAFTATYYAIGTLLTLVSFVFKIGTDSGMPTARQVFVPSAIVWVGLLYASIFATTYPFNAFSYAGKFLSAGVVSVHLALQPIFTSALSFMFLGIPVTVAEVFGGLLVIIGLLISLKYTISVPLRDAAAIRYAGLGDDGEKESAGWRDSVEDSCVPVEGLVQTAK